jgi:hypothetical protein
MRDSIGTPSKVLNLDIRWTCVDSITLWSMSPPTPRNIAWQPFNMRLRGSTGPVWTFWKLDKMNQFTDHNWLAQKTTDWYLKEIIKTSDGWKVMQWAVPLRPAQRSSRPERNLGPAGISSPRSTQLSSAYWLPWVGGVGWGWCVCWKCVSWLPWDLNSNQHGDKTLWSVELPRGNQPTHNTVGNLIQP